MAHPVRSFSKPDDAGSGNPDPTMKKPGGAAGAGRGRQDLAQREQVQRLARRRGGLRRHVERGLLASPRRAVEARLDTHRLRSEGREHRRRRARQAGEGVRCGALSGGITAIG